MSILTINFPDDVSFLRARVAYVEDYKKFKDELRETIKHIVTDNWINLAFVMGSLQLVVKVKKSLTKDEMKEVKRIFSQHLGLNKERV